MPKHRPLVERFWDYVWPEPTSGCWLWSGAIADTGYGSIRTSRPEPRTLLAHRLSYELTNGPIPEGLELDHKCRVRCCVNPEHLEPVTHSVNHRRGIGFNRRKMHCPKGHSYAGENLRIGIRGDGSKFRMCRICSNAARARFYAKRKNRHEISDVL